MPLESIQTFPWVRGIVASNQPLAEPKGAVTRASNLLMTARGGGDVCDGSQLLHAYQGLIQSGRGRHMADFYFQPIGVSSYYLALIKALDIHLGPPQHLTSALASGGSLVSGTTYYYKVTALDGASGETSASNEISATPSGGNLKVTLTWNIVPNAQSYNIYRATSSGAEVLYANTNLPVAQPGAGSLTASYTDDGSMFIPGTTSISSGKVIDVEGFAVIQWIVNAPMVVNYGDILVAFGCSPSSFNNTYQVIGIQSTTQFQTNNPAFLGLGASDIGGAFIPGGMQPPASDNTQQVALFKMPLIVGSPAAVPVSYDNSNIVALYPADLPKYPGGGGGGGGSGGGGGTGSGGSGGSSGSSTPSGGILGNLSFIPQFKQFTNRAIIALGNGFPMQIFSDPTTAQNPATTAVISAISVDANGIVSVTTSTPHGLSTTQVGGNVQIAGVINSIYDYVGPTIDVADTTHYKVRNLAAIGAGASSGGTSQTTAIPVTNTFVPAYPVWAATQNLIVGDVIVPATQPTANIYLVVTQGGQTGGSEPTWPTGGLASVGQTVKDGTVIYTVAGLLNSAAPAPPGAAHIEVYSGALWAFNTSPTNTSSGLDGPCSLRMSSINNPNGWNPINQAFLDRDDGQEGMGLAKFTITAQGIPPQGSLVAFKNYLPYQIVGLFGATNFLIQAVSSDMGCIAPRTLQFVPGFGIMRYTHLGIAVFNGVKDELISEPIRPYLFPNNDLTYADITVVDANWVSIAWGAQTATPPMYIFAAPIGISSGMLTRIFCFDLIFKAWLIVDLPFALGTVAQFRTLSANPVTIFGGFNDGCLSRWQAGDTLWDEGGSGARVPSQVAWSGRSLTMASKTNDQRIYVRRVVLTGTNSSLGGMITISWRKNGVQQGQQSFSVVANADFDLDLAIGQTGKRFDVTFSGNTDAQLDGLTFEPEPRPAGVVVGI